MKILIIKLGASGDVIRTTTLLHLFSGDKVDWITSDLNSILLHGIPNINRIYKESEVEQTEFSGYDLVINLEDGIEAAKIFMKVPHRQLFGAYLGHDGQMTYTEDSSGWFDLSLISKHGLQKANQLKYENQKSYQELIFRCLGYEFKSETYFLPESPATNLYGDVAIAPSAGKVWPMKNWAYFDELTFMLRAKGYTVNHLPTRTTMLEHLSDIRNHSVLISGDSLPMHFALGSGINCLTFFTCTSPAEIYHYGVMTKLISPDLEKYFYKRDFHVEATKSIKLTQALEAFAYVAKKRAAYA